VGARDHDDDNKRTLRFFVWRLLKNEWTWIRSPEAWRSRSPEARIREIRESCALLDTLFLGGARVAQQDAFQSFELRVCRAPVFSGRGPVSRYAV